MNIRLLPPVSVPAQTRVVNGRSYTAAPGSVIDVYDADAEQLQANGWIPVAPSGPTGARPSGTLGLYTAAAGSTFFDMTLGKLIISDGQIGETLRRAIPYEWAARSHGHCLCRYGLLACSLLRKVIGKTDEVRIRAARSLVNADDNRKRSSCSRLRVAGSTAASSASQYPGLISASGDPLSERS
jgi:hypothetical protein